MNKLSKKEFILKAAILEGLEDYEIIGLEKHLDGICENEYIVRRNKRLFHMYDVYMSKDYNERMDTDEEGIINLNDYAFIFSKRRLQDSIIGRTWLISSNLETFLITNLPSTDIITKHANIAEKNNFLLPQIAKQLGLDATIYYKGRYFDEDATEPQIYFMTKNFIREGESFIPGNKIFKRKKDWTIISLENLLEKADKFVKKQYKKRPEEGKEARKKIKEGLIKQTIFNKLVFNSNEANNKWGLIKNADNDLILAPLYSFDRCAGVKSSAKNHYRSVNLMQGDVESIIKKYSKEPWMEQWIRENVISLDLDKSENNMFLETGIKLSETEREYYRFLIGKMQEKIKKTYDELYCSKDKDKDDDPR